MMTKLLAFFGTISIAALVFVIGLAFGVEAKSRHDSEFENKLQDWANDPKSDD